MIFLLLGLSMLFIFAVCLHSVDEIHYLKAFFPQQFTVEQAYYASVIELIKIIILCFPFLILIYTSLAMLRQYPNKQS